MLKFNNDNLFTGHIKQILSSFNLPTYRIYSHADELYLKNNGKESPVIFESVPAETKKYKQHIHNFLYIKNSSVYKYNYKETSGSDATTASAYGIYYWSQVASYYPGQKVLNNTKRLKIKNNIYDTYTHEYLGNYLRFLRDYYRVNLMPLYNCFSNKICDNLLIDYSNAEAGTKFIFNSNDTKYKFYMLPVKLFKNYTIAIDSDMPVEICCGLFNKYYYKSFEYLNFPQDTYKFYPQLKFNNPILYTALTDIFKTETTRENILDIAKSEEDLKMFIKVPSTAVSSITILEGDYRNYNDSIQLYTNGDVPKDLKIYTTNTAYEEGTLIMYAKSIYKVMEAITASENQGWGYIKDKVVFKYSIADKKHYLQNHCVTNFENSAKNDFISIEEFYSERDFKPITKLDLLTLNTGESYPFSSKLIEYLSDNAITDIDETPDNITRAQKVVKDKTLYKIDGFAGVWDPRIPPAIYEYVTSDENKLIENKDILGYIDKSVETNYAARDPVTRKTNSIANVDIYEDLYLALKEQES